MKLFKQHKRCRIGLNRAENICDLKFLYIPIVKFDMESG